MRNLVQDLVDGVRKYAADHYTDGGWDVIVEAYDDDAIAGIICDEGAETVAQAIEAVKPIVDVYADRQADARHYQEEAA